MGVSSRATHAMEPRNGDLLMPGDGRKPRADRMRDIEDACFESVGAPRDVFSTRSRTGAGGGVFKSRIIQPPADGPIPRDFARSDRASRHANTQGERLGVFAGSKTVFAAGRSRPSMAVSAFVLTVCVVAATAFWIAGGHALVAQPAAKLQASAANAATATDRAAVSPDPVVTSSIPLRKTETTHDGFTSPSPRPARIERAGSILMIRPAGN